MCTFKNSYIYIRMESLVCVGVIYVRVCNLMCMDLCVRVKTVVCVCKSCVYGFMCTGEIPCVCGFMCTYGIPCVRV